ncbi:hypothetical protein JCM33374_g866 [Metschnikowia sp. JCM 33374]|nr:hypothetical protein JCM33374_g866 [Metschnikowia sp. JCM 33374]
MTKQIKYEDFLHTGSGHSFNKGSMYGLTAEKRNAEKYHDRKRKPGLDEAPIESAPKRKSPGIFESMISSIVSDTRLLKGRISMKDEQGADFDDNFVAAAKENRVASGLPDAQEFLVEATTLGAPEGKEDRTTRKIPKIEKDHSENEAMHHNKETPPESETLVKYEEYSYGPALGSVNNKDNKPYTYIVVKKEPETTEPPEEILQSFINLGNATTVKKEPRMSNNSAPNRKKKKAKTSRSKKPHHKNSKLPKSMLELMEEKKNSNGRKHAMVCLPTSVFTPSLRKNMWDHIPSYMSQKNVARF